MKNNLNQEQLKEFYLRLCKGNEEAFFFVAKWVTYCHKFDDLQDISRGIIEAIETQNELTELLTCPFFKSYGASLLPAIYLAGEAYQASNTTEKNSLIGSYLSHEGNNVLRIVALICGDYKHLVEISEEIRHLTYIEHPESFEVQVLKKEKE